MARQERWAALSDNGRVVPVNTVERYIHHADPALVIEQIRQLLP